MKSDLSFTAAWVLILTEIKMQFVAKIKRYSPKICKSWTNEAVKHLLTVSFMN